MNKEWYRHEAVDFPELLPLRKILLTRLLIMGLTVGILPIVTGTVAAIREDVWFVAAMNVASYLAILFLFFVRGRSYRLSGLGFIGIILLAGLVLLTLVGTDGATLLWLFAPLILTALLFDRRITLIMTAGITSVLAAAGVCLYLDLLPWDLPLASWLVILLSFAAVSVFLVFSVQYIFSRLAVALRRERRLNTRLRTAAGENEELLREIHHRVKNNLQLMLSLLRLERSAAGDGERSEALDTAENRFSALALSYSFLDRTGGSLMVRFNDVVESMISQIHEDMTASGLVFCTTRIAPVVLGLERAVPMSLLVSEILEECSRNVRGRERTAEEPLRIALELTAGKSEAVFRIEGFSAAEFSATAGVESHAGTRKTEDLGRQIVESLADQVGASVSFFPEDSTFVRIQLPLEGKKDLG
jgi:two-component sensor histidine kinase